MCHLQIYLKNEIFIIKGHPRPSLGTTVTLLNFDPKCWSSSSRNTIASISCIIKAVALNHPIVKLFLNFISHNKN